jgi:hypothetical protein
MMRIALALVTPAKAGAHTTHAFAGNLKKRSNEKKPHASLHGVFSL